MFDVTPGGLVLRDLAPGETIEELRTLTGAPFTVDPRVEPVETSHPRVEPVETSHPQPETP